MDSVLSWVLGFDRHWLLPIMAVVSFALSFIGAAVGLVLGHLRLPLLIAYLASPTAGAANNLLISGSGALAGSARHLRDGRVSWLGLAVMGIPSAVGVVVAVILVERVNPLWSYVVIGVMLIISGINLIVRKPTAPPPGDISLARRVSVEVVIGFGLGGLAAITGLMLGSLRLPMMIKYLRMDPKEAVGTNMAVGCLTGLVGAATAFMTGTVRLDWLVLAAVVPPTLLGGYLGGWVTGALSKEGVQRLAGWIITFSGVVLAGQGGYIVARKKAPEVPPLIVYQTAADDDWYYDDEWIDDDGDLPEEEL